MDIKHSLKHYIIYSQNWVQFTLVLMHILYLVSSLLIVLHFIEKSLLIDSTEGIKIHKPGTMNCIVDQKFNKVRLSVNQSVLQQFTILITLSPGFDEYFRQSSRAKIEPRL